MDGLLLIDKPAGMTSHDVVGRVRRLARTKKVGHTGTLDPDATGLLPLTIGQCTRLAQYLILDTKEYLFSLELGTQTDTDDASGAVIARSDPSHVTSEVLERALQSFRGPILQRPPKYSAIRVDGERAYDLARRGVVFELEPRPVTVLALTLEGVDLPSASFTLRCTSGTYVRSIVRDLGVAMGTHAHTTRIRRTQVGAFRIEDAVTLDDLEAEATTVADVLRTPAQMMASLRGVALSSVDVDHIRHGRAVRTTQEVSHDEHVCLLDAHGALVAVAVAERAGAGDEVVLKPRRVLRA
ncbi:MAG: tRNA pseudouridine(55) synthase TruB [Myxococcota bacterium]